MPSLAAADSTKIVLIVLVAKAAGYAICLGCGLPGGPVFPAIFLGIALAELTHVWFDVSPTLAVAVGAAAGMAAGTRLLITSTLFAPARRHRRAGCRSRRRARRLRRLDDGASA